MKDNTQAVQTIAKSFACKAFESARNEEQMDALWSARRQAYWASLAVRDEGTQVWSTDVAVPLSRLADLIGDDFAFLVPFPLGASNALSLPPSFAITVRRTIANIAQRSAKNELASLVSSTALSGTSETETFIRS